MFVGGGVEVFVFLFTFVFVRVFVFVRRFVFVRTGCFFLAGVTCRATWVGTAGFVVAAPATSPLFTFATFTLPTVGNEISAAGGFSTNANCASGVECGTIEGSGEGASRPEFDVAARV